MTVETTDNVVEYTGDGLNVTFPYAFKVLDAAHMVVTLIDIASGVESAPLTATSYLLTGVGNPAGGSVSYPLIGSAVPATTKVRLTRTVPFTQETDIPNQGGFFPAVVNESLDLLEMQIQQVNSKVTSILAGLVDSASLQPSGISRRQLLAAMADVTNPAGVNIIAKIASQMSPIGEDAASVEWTANSPMVINDPLYTQIQSIMAWTGTQMTNFTILAISKAF